MTLFSLTEDTKSKSLAIFYDNGDTVTLPDSHPSFRALVDLWLSGEATDEAVRDLANVMKTLANRMSQLSDRVSFDGKTLYFDGDPLQGELAEVIKDLFNEGNSVDATPLVRFLEKAKSNPNLESIDQLYAWVRTGQLQLTDSGDFLAYKGLHKGEDGVGRSGFSGDAWVNGVEYKNSFIPYPIGCVATMSRSAVNADGGVACSTGLHAGTFSYARSYAQFKMVLVQINPRDVVSVPTDAHGEKLRVRRFVVLKYVTAPVERGIYHEGVADGYTGPETEETPIPEVAATVKEEPMLTLGDLRDEKGRFTKEGAKTAARNLKGQFVKRVNG